MRPYIARLRIKPPVVMWASIMSLCLFAGWAGTGEATTRHAEPPATQVASPLIARRSAETPAIPKVLARRTFGSPTEALFDLVLDPSAHRIYLSDGGGRLHVLDADSLETIRELPVSGLLTLDDKHNRIYVAPGEAFWLDDENPQVTVIDTKSLETIGVIPEARFVSLDSTHGRIFAGNPLRMTEPQDRGVRTYAADSLELLAESDLVGIPVYDAEADELLVLAYSVSVVDPATLTFERDLLPELAQQPFQWCNGCERAWRVSVHPDDGLVVVQMTKTSTGGPGFSPQARIFDAQSLEERKDENARPTILPTCGSQTLLLWPEGGRRYVEDGYFRTVSYRNFRVTDDNGVELAWRDGLSLPFIHPRLGYGISDTGYVIDLERLTPSGRVPAFCTMAYDAAAGLIYGSNVNELIVFADHGGEQLGSPPTEPDPLPDRAITKIVVSPNFTEDHTLFVLVEDTLLYRSTDGGQTWSRVQGGLPVENGPTLDVAISPAYGEDRTLFAGGHTREWLGHGVLRSTDGGDTWQPLWNRLANLRVFKVAVSPDYAEDGAVWAYSYFTRLHPWQSGVALQRSTDRGLTWTSVITASYADELPSPDDLFQTDTSDLPARVGEDGRQLQVTDDGGESWQAVDLKKGDDEYLLSVLPSPGYPDDHTLFVLGDWAIWRSEDDGATWSRWTTPQLAEQDYNYRLTALAFSPSLEDGNYPMLIGTSTGELLQLTPSGSNTTPTARSGAQDRPGVSSEVTDTVPIASPALAEPLAGEPPDGFYRPQGALASLWEAEPRTQQELGWALNQDSLPMNAAVQAFEHGSMLWRGDTGAIYVLYDDHAWEVYIDQFREGEAETDPSLQPPQGLLQPIRGFGKLWRTNTDVREKLGWARAKEQGFQGYVHPFEHGLLISSGTGILILADDTDGQQTWR